MNDDEKAIRIFIEKHTGVKMPRRRKIALMRNLLLSFVGIFLALILGIYGFFAFIDPKQYPIIAKFIGSPPIYDSLIGLIFIGMAIIMIALIYIVERVLR